MPLPILTMDLKMDASLTTTSTHVGLGARFDAGAVSGEGWSSDKQFGFMSHTAVNDDPASASASLLPTPSLFSSTSHHGSSGGVKGLALAGGTAVTVRCCRLCSDFCFVLKQEHPILQVFWARDLWIPLSVLALRVFYTVSMRSGNTTF